MFITTVKPYKAISRDTLARWTKSMLKYAGVSIKHFQAHSVRSAATSAAFVAKVPLGTILKTACWSKECTFRKHYNKPVRRDSSFPDSLLNQGF